MLACSTFLCLVGWMSLNAQSTGDLISKGATWKYLDDGSNQGTAWKEPGFDDSGWASGDAELGYGDGGENTVISYGPNANSKYITTYFRHSFEILDPTVSKYLNLYLMRDDGAVVYLNGTEVARSNMPNLPVNFLTRALHTVEGELENLFVPFRINPSLLRVGTNLLAVEIHKKTASNADLSFNLQLTNAEPQAILRGPYLQKASTDSMTIRWRTREPMDSRVRYGASPASLNMSVEDVSVVKDHEIRLTGLTAGTVYYYSVGSSTADLAGGDSQHFFKTTPLSGTSDPFRVWVLGDCGTGTQDAKSVRDAYYNWTGDTHTDLTLLLGDNAYPSGSDEEYQIAVFDMYRQMLRKTAFWSTRGNHEDFAADYYEMFSLPKNGEAGGLASGSEAYYSFDYANVHFICLDSDETIQIGSSAMLSWLENDLAATTQRWVIAFWHHPPYTKGSHDSDNPNDSAGRLFTMRELVLPILEDYGVDLVLTGHSHSYERSFLIDGHYGVSTTFNTSTMLLDGGDGQVNGTGPYQKHAGPRAGAVYCVTGSASKLSRGPLNHPVMFASVERLGSVVLDFAGDRMDLTFLDDRMVVRDSFTLLTADARPYLRLENLISGQQAEVEVLGAKPGHNVIVAYSLAGPGPTTTQYGTVNLTPPIPKLAPVSADMYGKVQISMSVPLNLAGQPVYVQAVELVVGGGGILSNSLAEIIQ